MTGKRSFVIVVLGFIAVCCDNDDSYIGGAFRSNPDVGIVFTDTFSITASSVLLDSLPTSGTGTALIGSYQDNLFGRIASKAYLQMYNESSWNIDETARYDSAVVLLPYSGYWYGDTTSNVTLEIQQVSEDFTGMSLPLYWFEEGNFTYFNSLTGLYNTSHLDSYSFVLAEASFKPRPNTTTDTIRARVQDARGTAWFEEATRSSNYFKSSTEFQKYFKGITINATSGGSIVGINASEAKIRIYYHEYNGGVFTASHFDINYSTAYWQFNQFKGDRDNTLLEALSPESNLIPSTLTDDQVYLQSGVGIMAKVLFPYIKNILNLHESLLINSASLVIEPVHGTYSDKFPLPQTLALYQTNQTNKPLAPLYMDYSESPQYASITYDNEFGKTSGYTFSITSYIQALVDEAGTQPDTRALLLGTPLTELRNSVDRACLGGGDHENYRMRLEVYFTYKK